MKSIPEIKTKYDALYLENANGADIYIYPYFIIMYSNRINFAIIGLDEISFNQSYVRFTETGSVPKDSVIIDETWAKVNKNGTPDKRFKGNYRIPVVKYGEITLTTDLGLNEEYEFSNYEFTEDFGKAFKEYQSTIKSLKNLNSKIEVEPEVEEVIKQEIIKLPILEDNYEEIEIKTASKNIYNTEASIIEESSKKVGKITRISGQVGQSEIKLFLGLEEWRQFSIDLLPTLSIEFKVDGNSNFLIIGSTHKEISPLKKGDVFSIIFEDESFIEKKFEVGRFQSGKIVKNLIILNDLELIALTQNLVKNVETFSGLKIPYEFNNIANIQYSNTSDGKKLFQIMSQRITEIKLILRSLT
ncbi:MAG: hypothetical protein ACOH2A_15760 [Sphingobacteriaceae bacterium]